MLFADPIGTVRGNSKQYFILDQKARLANGDPFKGSYFQKIGGGGINIKTRLLN